MVGMKERQATKASTGLKRLFDPQEVRRTLSTLFAPGQVFEIRVLKASKDSREDAFISTYAGYFDNIEDALRAMASIKQAFGFYVTLQECHPDLIHKIANRLVKQQQGASTADIHILRYHWLLIDCDPERLSGISSTDEQHDQSLEHARAIRLDLKEMGWTDPLEGDSGNGPHLIYKIDLEHTPENADLLKRVLQGLAKRFDIPGLHIDQTVYSPGQIDKLYGTMACKGDSTAQRPHRMSRLINVPDELVPVSLDLLNAIAVPAQEQPATRPEKKSSNKASTTVSKGFTVQDFIDRHNIATKPREDYQDGSKWQLELCPFCKNSDHNAILIERANGASGFNCSHNSCKNIHWEEFRLLYEPKGKKKKKEDVATIAERWAQLHEDEWAYDENGQVWRMFDGRSWEEQAEKSSFLDQYAVAALHEAGHDVNSGNMLNCFQRIAASHCKRHFVHNVNKVNFANGTLDTRTMQLVPHDQADNFTYCLPYEYDATGEYPTIKAFLTGLILEKEDNDYRPNLHGVQAIMAHIGLALLEDTSLHKALMAIGVPGAGKSTLLDLANETCGQASKEYVPHDVFSRELEGKRTRYAHRDKRIACLDEVPAEAFQEEEIVKEMIAHSGVPMRGLFKDDIKKNQWKPKLLMVTNDEPHYKDATSAFLRRLIIIRCPMPRYDDPGTEQLGQDPLIMEKFRPELGAFADACIRYALVVRQRGFYPQSVAMKRDLIQIANAGNPLKNALEDIFVVAKGAHTPTNILYNAYVQYCHNELGNSIKELGRPKFSTTLCSMPLGITAKKFDRNTRGLLGIRLRTHDDADNAETAIHAGALISLETAGDSRETALSNQPSPCVSACEADATKRETAETAEIQKLNYREPNAPSIGHISSSNKQDRGSIKNQNGHFAVSPSPFNVNPLDKPVHTGDGTTNSRLSAVSQPSLSKEALQLLITYEQAMIDHKDHYATMKMWMEKNGNFEPEYPCSKCYEETWWPYWHQGDRKWGCAFCDPDILNHRY